LVGFVRLSVVGWRVAAVGRLLDRLRTERFVLAGRRPQTHTQSQTPTAPNTHAPGHNTRKHPAHLDLLQALGVLGRLALALRQRCGAVARALVLGLGLQARDLGKVWVGPVFGFWLQLVTVDWLQLVVGLGCFSGYSSWNRRRHKRPSAAAAAATGTTTHPHLRLQVCQPLAPRARRRQRRLLVLADAGDADALRKVGEYAVGDLGGGGG
jgi:hypothetical protein